METGRRTFLKFIVFLINGVTAYLLAHPVLGYLLGPVLQKSATQWVEVGPMEKFAAGDPKPARIKYTSKDTFREVSKGANLWIVAGEKVPVVFSSVCTHLGCTIAWKPEEKIFLCPCHDGRYDPTGKVISGPPPKPLTRMNAKIVNGKLFVEV
ncbi:Rieske 2Fe-2S domain-containing protein [Candidatus Sumerlaeota bacterium]|nr:Rieske 2Fe-2S domain-containing protein [Candidatus Sumerlaeota bacterium]MBI3737311.1 Rieske 2Fe-2S domain-containing protein [Candidatus Sumerlaeota bacterium]